MRRWVRLFRCNCAQCERDESRARDWGLRLAEHALAASRRRELTKSCWVRLLSATVPMSGGFGLLYKS
jgi:hypothetical protein